MYMSANKARIIYCPFCGSRTSFLNRGNAEERYFCKECCYEISVNKSGKISKISSVTASGLLEDVEFDKE